ncbi:hypothetical protein GP936_11545, partial [Escherichia coli]|nr:hypothetical protein [Escherichia coli]MWS23553.1 hypothetical protein [Escherichia coli]MWU08048.1 hypothetical protein [Escherichia coli]
MTYKYNPFWQQRIRETVRHALNVHPRLYDPAVQRPLRQTRTRKPFPESLPRDEKRLLPAAPCCPNCGGS